MFFRTMCIFLISASLSLPVLAEDYDLVINNGRMMDPLTQTDAVRHLGIRDGTIAAISQSPLAAQQVIDASGMVVAPGFIDLHAHGQDPHSNSFQAADGVTTALELEIGVQPVDQWLASRAGKARIHYGASSSHMAARIKVLTGIDALSLAALRQRGDIDPGYMSAILTPTQRQQLIEVVDESIHQGGLGIGIGITYTPSATRDEIYDMFRLAAEYDAPVFVHMRNSQQTGNDLLAPLQEVLANAAASGAPLHVVHINSSTNESAPLAMELIRGARANGVDVTTESYPYTAGSTRIESAAFNDFRGNYSDLQWTLTGERLTKETFEEYRAQGGWVISHGRSEVTNAWLVAQPDVMVASDAVPFIGQVSHPRSAGTFARVLGHYARDEGMLDLMTALA